jgi:hypothetical protein
VGGFVYRGSQIPALQGKYVFADTGENEFTQPTNVVELYYGNPATGGISTRDDLFKLQIELPIGLNMPDRIWSIAEDAVGELYLLVGPSRGDLFVVGPGETDGGIYKLVVPTGAPNNLAGDINQDGMVDQNDVLALKAGWYTTGHATPFLQYTHGDLNFDGITNLLDLYLLHDALLAAGQSSGVEELSGQVPEPTGIALVIFGWLGCFYRRR